MAETKQQSPQAEALQLEGNELTALLKKEFKPKSDEAKNEKVLAHRAGIFGQRLDMLCHRPKKPNQNCHGRRMPFLL